MLFPTSNSIIGCLLGTAVGDAIELPYEGLSKRRQRRLYLTLNGHQLGACQVCKREAGEG